MEFDTNNTTRGSAEIDDEKRLSAATKRVTLAPLHEDVHPELKPDGSSEGEYGLDAPVANVPSDMENTSTTSKTPSVVSPEEARATTSTQSPAVAAPMQPTTPSNATISSAPAASFLPTNPTVTKQRTMLPIIILASAALVVVIGVVAFSIFFK